MRKFLFILSLLFLCNATFADPNPFDIIYDGYQVTYDHSAGLWCAGGIADGEVVLTKKLYDGAGSYSQYYNTDEKVEFTLTTDFEFVKDGHFIAIDNDELKYYEIAYNGTQFEQRLLDNSEIQDIFPDAEIISLANIDSDNKLWIHKPFLKKKPFLFVNDSDKFFHRLSAKQSKIQDKEIRGLVTISRYGIYRFKHFGQRDGKLTIYVR